MLVNVCNHNVVAKLIKMSVFDDKPVSPLDAILDVTQVTGSQSDHLSNLEQEPVVNGVVQPPFVVDGQKAATTNQLQFMSRVVNAVWRHQASHPFRSPVDTIKLGLTDYHDIIKRPMDLGTIKKRIENGFYHKSSNCIDDFRTMCSNCYAYNPKASLIVKMAKTIEQEFNKRLADLPQEEHKLDLPLKGVQKKTKGYKGRKEVTKKG